MEYIRARPAAGLGQCTAPAGRCKSQDAVQAQAGLGCNTCHFTHMRLEIGADWSCLGCSTCQHKLRLGAGQVEPWWAVRKHRKPVVFLALKEPGVNMTSPWAGRAE